MENLESFRNCYIWESFETNISNGKIKNFYDSRFNCWNPLLWTAKKKIILIDLQKVLFLNCSRVFSAYTAEVKTKENHYIQRNQ